jgi:6-phosphogluconate dehydrogenase
MGGNMAQRLINANHRVIVYDPQPETIKTLESIGAVGANSVDDLILKLVPPRAVWLMIPSGEPTEKTIKELADKLSPGDTILDGSNSYYKDGIRRSNYLSELRISFLDVGVSGGIWGLKDGYSLMIGGKEEVFQRLEPVFQSLAPSVEDGYGYVGPSGAGHFVKMVHNGIEYGLMEAYAEGFELMQAKDEFKLDLARIAEIWRYGTVIRSWLLDLTAAALKDDPELESLQAYVEDTGEGRWTVQESIDLSVPIPVITQSLLARFRSRQEQPFGARLLAALRNQFGGHQVHRKD